MKTELQYYVHELTRKAFSLILNDESATTGMYGTIECNGREVFADGNTKYRVSVDIGGENQDRLRIYVGGDFPLAETERTLIADAKTRIKRRERREEMETERQNLLDKLAAVDAKIKELENTPNE